jgi:Fe-S-cluster containining protein
MDDDGEFGASLAGCAAGEAIAGVRSLYRDIERDHGAFRARAGMSCPPGCGDCCRGFEPDILRPEALYAAAFIAERAPGAEALLDPSAADGGCPFWREDDPYHCAIYGGRGLVCRLFGYSSGKDKNGDLEFRPCKFMPEENRGRFSASARGAEPCPPPAAMSDYASRLSSLFPGSERGGLGGMVRDALFYIKYLRAIKG